MDIICKCGHDVSFHDEYGCLDCGYKNCKMNDIDVLHIHITEQQARLDTCWAQIEVLIKERDAAKAEVINADMASIEHFHKEQELSSERDALKDACLKAFERLGHCENWGSEVEDVCDILSTAIGVKNHGF